MSKSNKEQKLRLSPWRLIGIYIGLFIVFDLIFYISFQSKQLWPLETSFYFYTPLLFGFTVLMCVLSITKTYYLVDRNKVVHNKMGKIVDYSWANVIYINEDYSVKHKMLLFYDVHGNEHMLAFDKEGIIYQYAIKYSHLISKEDFQRRFPTKKL